MIVGNLRKYYSDYRNIADKQLILDKGFESFGGHKQRLEFYEKKRSFKDEIRSTYGLSGAKIFYQILQQLYIFEK